MSNKRHGGPRPATRPDDRRHQTSGARPNAGRRDCHRLECTKDGSTFYFEVSRKVEIEAVKRFAELLGYTVTVEKSTKGIIL